MNERTIKQRKICNNINFQADMYGSEYDIMFYIIATYMPTGPIYHN